MLTNMQQWHQRVYSLATYATSAVWHTVRSQTALMCGLENAGAAVGAGNAVGAASSRCQDRPVNAVCATANSHGVPPSVLCCPFAWSLPQAGSHTTEKKKRKQKDDMTTVPSQPTPTTNQNLAHATPAASLSAVLYAHDTSYARYSRI